MENWNNPLMQGGRGVGLCPIPLIDGVGLWHFLLHRPSSLFMLGPATGWSPIGASCHGRTPPTGWQITDDRPVLILINHPALSVLDPWTPFHGHSLTFLLVQIWLKYLYIMYIYIFVDVSSPNIPFSIVLMPDFNQQINQLPIFSHLLPVFNGCICNVGWFFYVQFSDNRR